MHIMVFRMHDFEWFWKYAMKLSDKQWRKKSSHYVIIMSLFMSKTRPKTNLFLYYFGAAVATKHFFCQTYLNQFLKNFNSTSYLWKTYLKTHFKAPVRNFWLVRTSVLYFGQNWLTSHCNCIFEIETWTKAVSAANFWSPGGNLPCGVCFRQQK